MSSLPLLLNLPHLMAPQHLATITSLELLWHFDKPRLLNSETMNAIWNRVQASPSTPPSSPPRTDFHALCELIPQVFPNARHLYIALQANIAPPHPFADEDRIPLVDRYILGPLEDMLRQIGPAPGKIFTVAIQGAGWHLFMEPEAKLLEPPRSERMYTGLGRYLSCNPQRLTEVCGKGHRFAWLSEMGLYFNHRLWRPLADGASEGYWLCPGWNDMALFPFGTGGGVYPLWE